MTRRFLLSLMLALCGVAAVHGESDLYNPLAVGMRWDVDVEVTPPGGTVIQGTAVRQITGTEKINNLTYFVVTTTITGLPKLRDFTMYRRKSERGIYAINALDKNRQEYLETALPLIVGQSWQTVVFGQVIVSTTEAKETVKMGEKTYENCLKISYQSYDKKLSGTFWQAPDVGNVKETMSIDGSVFKFTLKTFSGLK